LVSLDEAVIARYRRDNDHFEILIDPYKASDFLEGKQVNILNSLAIDAVFEDARKGEHASEESLENVFGTTNTEEIAKKILKKGDIQLTTEQRRKIKENKEKRIIESISRNAMDPKTKAPHPRQRIELAIKQADVHIDPFKPVSEQVKTIVEKIRSIIPISMEQIRVSVKIPAEQIGKAYSTIRNFGTLEREDWQSDGSWIGIIRLAAGMQNSFYEKINDVTKGNASTKILK